MPGDIHMNSLRFWILILMQLGEDSLLLTRSFSERQIVLF